MVNTVPRCTSPTQSTIVELLTEYRKCRYGEEDEDGGAKEPPTKDEVKERMNTMICTKWKWTGAENERSRCNLSRWLLKVKDTYGTDKFNPRDVEIFKLDHKKGKGSRKNSVPGTARYYPPYDALCCGYEVSRCPFMVTDDPSHTKMRLSPVFVECLKANRLL